MTANKDSARMTRRQFLRTAAALGGAAAACTRKMSTASRAGTQ